MKFHKINLETWDRAEYFRHFIDDVRCVMCLTARVDLTRLLPAVKKRGVRFYPAFIYVVAKVVNSRREWKLSFDEEGNVGYFDRVNPSYILFHKEDETFTRLVTPFSEDFFDCTGRITADLERYDGYRGFSVPDVPRNVFDLSCLPWLSYQSFDMHVFDSGAYLAPVVTWGKYIKSGESITMPLTMQVHHAAADGFHLCRFFKEVQREIDALSGLLEAAIR